MNWSHIMRQVFEKTSMLCLIGFVLGVLIVAFEHSAFFGLAQWGIGYASLVAFVGVCVWLIGSLSKLFAKQLSTLHGVHRGVQGIFIWGTVCVSIAMVCRCDFSAAGFVRAMFLTLWPMEFLLAYASAARWSILFGFVIVALTIVEWGMVRYTKHYAPSSRAS